MKKLYFFIILFLGLFANSVYSQLPPTRTHYVFSGQESFTTSDHPRSKVYSRTVAGPSGVAGYYNAFCNDNLIPAIGPRNAILTGIIRDRGGAVIACNPHIETNTLSREYSIFPRGRVGSSENFYYITEASNVKRIERSVEVSCHGSDIRNGTPVIAFVNFRCVSAPDINSSRLRKELTVTTLDFASKIKTPIQTCSYSSRIQLNVARFWNRLALPNGAPRYGGGLYFSGPGVVQDRGNWYFDPTGRNGQITVTAHLPFWDGRYSPCLTKTNCNGISYPSRAIATATITFRVTHQPILNLTTDKTFYIDRSQTRFDLTRGPGIVWTGPFVGNMGNQYFFNVPAATQGSHTLNVKKTVNSCVFRDQVTMTMAALPEVSFPIPTDFTTCVYDPNFSVTVNATGLVPGTRDVGYDWSGLVLISSFRDGATINVSSNVGTKTLRYERTVSLSGRNYTFRTSKKIHVVPRPVNDAVVNNVEKCPSDPSITTLSTSSPSGHSFRWYFPSGRLAGTGPSIFFPLDPPRMTKSRFLSVVKTVNGRGCESSIDSRKEVTATLHPAPPAPVFMSTLSPSPSVPQYNVTAACGSGQVKFNIAGPANYKYGLYGSPSGSVASDIRTHSTTNGKHVITVGPLRNERTYYLQAFSPPGCFSERIPVVAVVNNIPNAPRVSSNAVCGKGEINLRAFNAGDNQIYKWYRSGSSDIYESDVSMVSFPANTTTSPANLTFDVSLFNTNTLCESPRATVTGVVNPIPKQPVGLNDTICGSESVTLSVTDPLSEGGFYNWYSAKVGNTELDQGVNYSPSGEIDTTTSYWVDYTSPQGCTSERTEVLAVVQVLTDLPDNQIFYADTSQARFKLTGEGVTWTGPFVEERDNQYYFDVPSAGPDVYNLTATIYSLSATRTITILSKPTVSLNPSPANITKCISDDDFMVTPVISDLVDGTEKNVSHAWYGLVFSSSSVNEATIPVNSNVGTKTLTYTRTIRLSGRSYTIKANKQITILDSSLPSLPDNQSFYVGYEVGYEGGEVVLPSGTGITWAGTKVGDRDGDAWVRQRGTRYYFAASIATPGTYKLTINKTGDGVTSCSSSATRTFTVYTRPTITLNPDGNITKCISDDDFRVTAVISGLADGTRNVDYAWSNFIDYPEVNHYNSNINRTTIRVDNTNLGTKKLVYLRRISLFDRVYTIVPTKLITILDNSLPSLPDNQSFYVGSEGGEVDLPSGTGIAWTGTKVGDRDGDAWVRQRGTRYYFAANIATPGTYKLTINKTGDGVTSCSSSATRTFTVYSRPTVSLKPDGDITKCISDDDFMVTAVTTRLADGTVNVDHAWSGLVVSPSSVDRATVLVSSNLGTKTLNYTRTIQLSGRDYTIGTSKHITILDNSLPNLPDDQVFYHAVQNPFYLPSGARITWTGTKIGDGDADAWVRHNFRGYYFAAGAATPGTYKLTARKTISTAGGDSCTFSDTRTFRVEPLPTVRFPSLENITRCVYNSNFDVEVNFTGIVDGTVNVDHAWSGLVVSPSSVDRATVLVSSNLGTKTLNYTRTIQLSGRDYTIGTSKHITILDNSLPNLPDDQVFYHAVQNPFYLPSGARITWTGTKIGDGDADAWVRHNFRGYYFAAGAATPGTYKLTARKTISTAGGDSCTFSDTRTFRVVPLPTVSLNPSPANITKCISDDDFMVTPVITGLADGTVNVDHAWSGLVVSPSSVDRATVLVSSNLGTKTLNYTRTIQLSGRDYTIGTSKHITILDNSLPNLPDDQVFYHAVQNPFYLPSGARITWTGTKIGDGDADAWVRHNFRGYYFAAGAATPGTYKLTARKTISTAGGDSCTFSDTRTFRVVPLPTVSLNPSPANITKCISDDDFMVTPVITGLADGTVNVDHAWSGLVVSPSSVDRATVLVSSNLGTKTLNYTRTIQLSGRDYTIGTSKQITILDSSLPSLPDNQIFYHAVQNPFYLPSGARITWTGTKIGGGDADAWVRHNFRGYYFAAGAATPGTYKLTARKTVSTAGGDSCTFSDTRTFRVVPLPTVRFPSLSNITGCVYDPNINVAVNFTGILPQTISVSHDWSGLIFSSSSVDRATIPTSSNLGEKDLNYSRTLRLSDRDYTISTSKKVTIANRPVNDAVVNNVEKCPSDTSLTTLYTSSPAGHSFRWYFPSGRLASEDSSVSFPLEPPRMTKSRFLSVVNRVGCESALSARKEVTATLNPAPAAPVLNPVLASLPDDPQYNVTAACGVGVVKFNIAGPASYRYGLYASFIGTVPSDVETLAKANGKHTFTTPSLTTSQRYYLQAFTSKNCFSVRIPVDAVVNNIPNTLSVSSNTIYGAGEIVLTASNAGANQIYRWYRYGDPDVYKSDVDTLSFQANTHTSDDSLTYEVSLFDTTTLCESPRVTVKGVVMNIMPAPPVGLNDTICGPGNVTLSVDTPLGEGFYSWYSTEVGNTKLAQGVNYLPSGKIDTTTYYWVNYTNLEGSTSERTKVLAIVNPIPESPTIFPIDSTICSRASILLNVQEPATELTYHWLANNVPLDIANTIYVRPRDNTVYTVKSQDTSGCFSPLAESSINVVNIEFDFAVNGPAELPLMTQLYSSPSVTVPFIISYSLDTANVNINNLFFTYGNCGRLNNSNSFNAPNLNNTFYVDYSTIGYYAPTLTITTKEDCAFSSFTHLNILDTIKKTTGQQNARQQIDNDITDVNSDLSENKIRLYPVPFENSLMVSFQSDIDRNVDFILFSLVGNLVFQKSYSIDRGSNVLSIQLNDLPNAMYFVYMTDNNGFYYHSKILKE